MPRVRKGAARRRKHKRVLKAARGFFGAGSRRYRIALDKVFRAGVSATRDRRLRKRNFRRLWITRITAACRQRGIRYSQFMFGLTEADIMLNRKMLSEIAIADPAAFDELVAIAQSEKAPPEKKAPRKAEKPAKAEKKEPRGKATPEEAPVEAQAPAEEEKKPVKKAAKKTATKADNAGEAKPEKKAVKKAATQAGKKDDKGQEKPAKKKAVKKAAKKAAKKTAKKSEKKDD